MKKVSVNILRVEEFLAQINPICNFGINIEQVATEVVPVINSFSEVQVPQAIIPQVQVPETVIEETPIILEESKTDNTLSSIEGAEMLEVADGVPEWLKELSKNVSNGIITNNINDDDNTVEKVEEKNVDEENIESETNNLSAKVSELFGAEEQDNRKEKIEENNIENIQAENMLEEDIPTSEESVLLEKTLTISEEEGTVTLPYTIEELTKVLEANPRKYSSLEDVIYDIYTVPLKTYKNSATSRFKEAYKLIRKKEHGSIGEALDLGMELFSNYSLHPAIITACKNINELDIYLSCLEYDELDDFNFFKVVFNVAPVAKKSYGRQKLQKAKEVGRKSKRFAA
jgi:hypothetical protein